MDISTTGKAMQLVRLDLSCHALDGGIPVGLRALGCLEVWAAETRGEHWLSSHLAVSSCADGIANLPLVFVFLYPACLHCRCTVFGPDT